MVCVRGIISFFTILIFTRILGKQQLGEITFFDYILGITIGSFSASLTIDLSSAAWPHWIGLLTWIILGLTMQYVSLKSKNISQCINDQPIIVVQDGKIIGEALKSTKYTLSELLEQLRIKEIFDINEIKFAIIEANGQLSVLRKEQFHNLVCSMDISSSDSDLCSVLIFNGIVIDHNLKVNKLNREWLFNELKKQNFDDPIEVFYASIDLSKKLQIDSYKNKIISSKDIFK